MQWLEVFVGEAAVGRRPVSNDEGLYGVDEAEKTAKDTVVGGRGNSKRTAVCWVDRLGCGQVGETLWEGEEEEGERSPLN